MSREAIESFVDEIRDELPRMRRAFAIMHAWPDDRNALLEAHRLTHSIKGTAALVGVHKLSEIAERQEALLEQLLDGRLTMSDGLRDTLERMADFIESFADSLQTGSVPEAPAPSAIEVKTIVMAEQVVGFREEALAALRELAEKLDNYRCDLTRWDLLADVRRRVHSLHEAAAGEGLPDFADLGRHAEQLLQRVLDRTVPPSENAADCLQACVDALEQRLDRDLDEAIRQLLHERLDELCDSSSKELVESEVVPPAASRVDEPNDGRSAVVSEVAVQAVSPDSVELDDRGELSEEMLEVFTEEAEDHLRQIYSAFTELEADPSRMSSIQEVRRSAHTIKGAAGSVGLRLVSKLSHRMEDLLDVLFSSQQPIAASTLALLYDTTDALQDLVHGNFAPEGMQVTVAQLFDSAESRWPKAESRYPFPHWRSSTR
ncbi:MAG: two-component system chemotaxis family sensor kinase CheA [Planctomycetota bacterium]|nr:MAG: two-component system chemotaxis family sensor kinase CheA [Planctomycetota bacterium]